jgi:hypothetical protein
MGNGTTKSEMEGVNKLIKMDPFLKDNGRMIRMISLMDTVEGSLFKEKYMMDIGYKIE